MNLVYTKPIYAAQKQIEYQKHLNRHRKTIPLNQNQSIIRNRMASAHFQIKQNKSKISEQNQKMYNRLMDISQKRSISFSNKLDYIPQTIAVSPFRRKQMQRINEQNQQLAQRLIAKQSEFNPSRINKSIAQYEKVKRTMIRNKRLNLPNLKRQNTQLLDKSI